MIVNEQNYLSHYGILRRSGRYPWGSGGTTPTRSKSFLDYVKGMQAEGLTESEIAKGVGLSINDLRAMKSIASNRLKQYNINWATRLRNKGMSTQAIGDRMGVPESTVRSWLKGDSKRKLDTLEATMEMLKSEVAKKEMIDVGLGVENQLSISNTQLKTAVAGLKMQGYELHYIRVPQIGTAAGKDTTQKVLCPPGTPYSYVYQNREKVQQVLRFSNDFGETWPLIKPPVSVDSSRVKIRYAEDGGENSDGVLYVRPGVKDLSMGKNRYAQVRVMVDNTHYIKGMAIYKNDLPDGVDIVFNTNKSKSVSKLDVLKPLEKDAENPFGTIVRQITDENDRVTSAMNIVSEAGDWNKWSRTLASQVLSKQEPSVAKEQLDLMYDSKKREYDEIMSLTNPTVRRKLLSEFSDEADAASIHLKAAKFPRQRWQVILPVEKMSPKEVYAPNFEHGERVVLIRYPHGGKFEIPELTVNNRSREAQKLLGTSKDLIDGIGIHPDVAKRLSGADFDGDTVLVIPNKSGKIKTLPAIEELKNFNPKQTFKLADDVPVQKDSVYQTQMGLVSNLITDMTVKGAPISDITRAVKHSMVVIDAKKHRLDMAESAQVHNIRELMTKYQNRPTGGAATVISRGGANSKESIPKRRLARKSEGGPIDLVTGRKVYVPTGESYVNKEGKTVFKTEKVPRLSLVDDVHTVSSGSPIERIYADHSNRMKALANEARLNMIRTPLLERSPSAAKAYAPQVASLSAALQLANQNKPLERRAQVIANATVAAKKAANPNLEPKQIKKIESMALETARKRVGAKKNRIQPTQEEWNAIQAGAISDTRLSQILDNADMDHIRALATPKTVTLMTSAKTSRAKKMLDLGYTMSEVAEQLGVSISTVERSLEDQ